MGPLWTHKLAGPTVHSPGGASYFLREDTASFLFGMCTVQIEICESFKFEEFSSNIS